MLWIAVCDDEVMECNRIAKKIGEMLAKMKVRCTIKQFYNGRELLQSSDSFDLIFLDIIMGEMDDIFYFEIRGRLIDVHGTGGIFSYYGQISV